MRIPATIVFALALAAALAAAPGCASAPPTRVHLDPIEIEPIHLSLDVSVPAPKPGETPETEEAEETEPGPLARPLALAFLVGMCRVDRGRWPESPGDLAAYAADANLGPKLVPAIRVLEFLGTDPEGRATYRFALDGGPDGGASSGTLSIGATEDRDP